MEGVLEEIQFLANSANRIGVLDTLTNGPSTRRELQEETGIPRSTAARVLDEAEARGWVTSEGSQYKITPRGEVMVSEFCAYMETTKGIHHLGKAIEWLPEPVHALDFRYFRDADITLPTEDNPTAPVDRGMELLRAANEFRTLTQNSIPEYMKIISDRVVRGQLDFEGVIEAAHIQTLRDNPKRAATWHDFAHRMWVVDDPIPINMHIIDETAVIWLCDENHAGDDVIIKGLLESEHPSVISWLESLYEEYRDGASRLNPEILPSE